MSKYDHFAAIQALLIYIVMRVIDNSVLEPDLKLDLFLTDQVRNPAFPWKSSKPTTQGLCNSFKDLCNEPFSRNERLYPSPNWQEWDFAESRRR